MLPKARHCCVECCLEWECALPACSSCIRCEKLITIGALPLAAAGVPSPQFAADLSMDGLWVDSGSFREISPIQKMAGAVWHNSSTFEDDGPWKVLTFACGAQERCKLSRGGNVLGTRQRPPLDEQASNGFSHYEIQD